MLKEFMEKIFNDYQSARKENYVDNPLVKLIKKEFPDNLSKYIKVIDNYKCIGYPGAGNWAESPYVDIFNPDISKGLESGYFVLYIFSEQTEKVYLTLNQSIGNRNNLKREELETQLLNRALKIRSKLSIPEKFDTEELSGLGPDHRYKRLEKANICSKTYYSDNLPSEYQLEADLNEMLNLYNELIGKLPKVWQISPGSVSTGEQDKLWPLFRDNGFIGIGWLHDSQSYLDFDNVDELKDALINFYPNYSETDPSSAARMVWDFTHNIKKGDIIVANAGYRQSKGIGIVKSDYICPEDSDNPGIFDYFWHLRKIDWLITDNANFNQQIFYQQTLAELNEERWNRIKNAYINKNSEYSNLFEQMDELIEVKGIKEYMDEIGKIIIDPFDEKKVEKVFNNFYHYLDQFNGDMELRELSLNHNIPYISFGIPDSDFYIEYITPEDKEGIYLSLSHGIFAMRDILSGNGPKLGLQSKKDINNFVNRSGRRIESFRSIINSSGNFLPEMDLKTVNATSGPLYEVCSIYSKYYPFENLPTEIELVSDLNKIIKLYYQLVRPSADIRTPLEFIFNNLPVVKSQNQQVKGHEVGRAFLDIKDKIYGIANTISPEKSYNSVAYYQSIGQWSKKPYIYIEDTQHKDKFGHWDQHFVGFWFTEDLDGVLLSLEQSGNYAKHFLKDKNPEFTDEELEKYLKEHVIKVREQIRKSPQINLSLEHFSKDIAFKGTTVFGKYYDKNNLPSNDQIISDFKELFKMYLLLEPDENGGTAVKTTFFEDLAEQGYFFDYKLVENFLLSLKVKPFVILTGNSGTGKTKVAQLFAQYLRYENDTPLVINEELAEKYLTKKEANKYLSTIMNSLGTYPNDQVRDLLPDLIEKGIIEVSGFNDKVKYEIVPVGANWTENRHIIGFYNVITGKYNDTRALNLILSAEKDGDEPYFLILDEMNLSHVERYFSDFLSAMESNEDIELHSNENLTTPPSKIKLPSNLFVIGTVNVDETTYMFSPKVLDRANTLEFLTQPAMDYMSNSPGYNVNGDIDYLLNPLSDVELRDENINDLKNTLNHVRTQNNLLIWDLLASRINEFQEVLKHADFDFGFRTINEIIRFMIVSWKYEGQPDVWENWERYFDSQILQKMLPKLHGSQRELDTVLNNLRELCDESDEIIFPYSAQKLDKMLKRLSEKRYVAFTG